MRLNGDKAIGLTLLAVAMSAFSGLAVITAFIFKEGLPIMMKVGVWNFVTSSDWYPLEGHFGIFPMILGSLAVTAGAMVVLGVGGGPALWLLMPVIGALVSTCYVNLNTLTQMVSARRQGLANSIYRSIGAGAGVAAPLIRLQEHTIIYGLILKPDRHLLMLQPEFTLSQLQMLTIAQLLIR